MVFFNSVEATSILTHRETANLPKRLQDADNADVKTVLQQSWAKFTVETSVLSDFYMLMAMVPNITFSEFLAFMIEGNDSTEMVRIGAKRIEKMTTGHRDPIVKEWHKSDPTHFEPNH